MSGEANLLPQPPELHFKSIRIRNVETRLDIAAYDLQPATLQFRFDLFFVAIPVSDGISDVIDARRAGRPSARNEDVVAKRQPALFSVIFGNLHPEEARIKIARLRIIGDLIGDVIE